MNKVILTVIAALLIGLSSYAQTLKVNEVDDFTGALMKATDMEKIAVSKVRNTLKMNLGGIRSSDGTEVYVMYAYSTLDQGCSGARGNEILIKFTDGTVITLTDVADIDCSDDAASMYNMTEYYNDLENKTIDKIRFQQGDTYDDFTLDLDKSKLIQRMLDIVTL